MNALAEDVQLTAFQLGNEEYALDIMRVREILRPVPVTPVRNGPKYVEGVINLRGTVLPIVDLRHRFGLRRAQNRLTRILVTVIDGRWVGLVVDAVTEVVRTHMDAIQPASGFLAPEYAPFFCGVCQHSGRTILLLNIRSIVSRIESIDANALATENGGAEA